MREAEELEHVNGHILLFVNHRGYRRQKIEKEEALGIGARYLLKSPLLR